MAGVSDDLRGDGLVRVHRALDGLEADPFRLERARMRFSQPPPSYTSNPSGTTTQSGSPEPSSDEQRRREQQDQIFHRRQKLITERAASLPLYQFNVQVDEEKRRIFNADPRVNWMTQIPIGGSEEIKATETIKKRWVEQGIWKDKWDEMVAGRNWDIGLWKHEEPLEVESESETDTEAESPPQPFNLFGAPRMQSQPKPRRPKSDGEKRRIAERRIEREREREASRRYHQFVCQISTERERIQDEMSRERAGEAIADINTRAYESVKTTLTERGMRIETWGILPGMSWKHEEPLEEEAGQDPAPVPANPLVTGNHVVEVHTRRNFEPPSPIESNHHQVSSALNSPRQNLSADVYAAGLENAIAERVPSTLSSPRPSPETERFIRPTAGQASRKKSSHKVGQSQPVAGASLSPVHPSKVSKAAGKKRPGPQRRPKPNATREVPSDDPPLFSSPDINEPLPQTASSPPRRSNRLQLHEASVANGPAGITSMDSPKRIAATRLKRRVADNPQSVGLAKPQGISKKRRPSSTPRKGRKDGK